MKKLALSLAVLIAATLMGAPSIALDQRITLSASRDLALNGTYVNISSGSGVGEASTYDWANFKYEVHQESSNPGILKGVISQASFAQCPGQFSLDTSSLRACNFEIASNRMIIGAPGTNAPGALLKITALGDSGVTIRIRSWLDVNGDNRASSFEPTSNWSTISFLPAEAARPYVNMSVTPPLLVNRFMEAYVADGGNPLGGLGLFSLTDSDNLKMRLVSCDSVGCESTFVTGAFVTHPQFQSRKFTGARTNWDTGRYRFELLYSPGIVDDYVLASQEFDYVNRSVIEVESQIETRANKVYKGPILSLSAHWQEAKSLELSEKTFTYSATLRNAAGEPVVGAEVNLYVDIKELSAQTAVRADGVILQSQVRDEVLLRRVTDKNGQVTVVFENPNPKDRDQISIDLSTQGLLATEYRGTGGREFAIWELDRKAVLAVSGGSASGGNAVELTATLLGESGFVQNHSVGLSATFPLTLERTAAKTDAQGKIRSKVHLSHLATGSGSQVVTVFTVYDSEVITASYEASWDASGAMLEFKPLVEEVELGLAISTSALVRAKPGATAKISATVLDSSSKPLTSSPLTGLIIDYHGPGVLLEQAPTSTDSNGNININLLIGSQDSGEGVMTFTLLNPVSGGLVVKRIKVVIDSTSANISIGTFNGKVVVYAKDALGSRLSVKAGGKWYVKTLTKNFDSLSFRSRTGVSVPVTAYLDGRPINSKTVTTR